MVSINLEMLFALQGEMTDTDFSQKLGVSRTQLWRIRRNPSSVGIEFIEKIKICFPEVNLNELFVFSDRSSLLTK